MKVEKDWTMTSELCKKMNYTQTQKGFLCATSSVTEIELIINGYKSDEIRYLTKHILRALCKKLGP